MPITVEEFWGFKKIDLAEIHSSQKNLQLAQEECYCYVNLRKPLAKELHSALFWFKLNLEQFLFKTNSFMPIPFLLSAGQKIKELGLQNLEETTIILKSANGSDIAALTAQYEKFKIVIRQIQAENNEKFYAVDLKSHVELDIDGNIVLKNGSEYTAKAIYEGLYDLGICINNLIFYKAATQKLKDWLEKADTKNNLEKEFNLTTKCYHLEAELQQLFNHLIFGTYYVLNPTEHPFICLQRDIVIQEFRDPSGLEILILLRIFATIPGVKSNVNLEETIAELLLDTMKIPEASLSQVFRERYTQPIMTVFQSIIQMTEGIPEEIQGKLRTFIATFALNTGFKFLPTVLSNSLLTAEQFLNVLYQEIEKKNVSSMNRVYVYHVPLHIEPSHFNAKFLSLREEWPSLPDNMLWEPPLIFTPAPLHSLTSAESQNRLALTAVEAQEWLIEERLTKARKALEPYVQPITKNQSQPVGMLESIPAILQPSFSTNAAEQLKANQEKFYQNANKCKN